MRFLSTLLASALGTLIAFAVVVLFFVLFFFALALSGDQKPPVTPNSVLTLTVDGPIPEQITDDPFARAFGDQADYDLRDVQTALRNAAADDRIRAVWLRLKGVQAPWATLEEVRSALLKFRESGKPVIASSGEFSTSEPEYYLASAADSVFSAPASQFVLNGFEASVSFYEGTLEKLNVEPKIVRAGQYKGAVEPYLRSDLSDPNRLQLTELLETINDRFKQDLSATRGMTPDEIESMADEAPVIDSDVAFERGLIDDLRYDTDVEDVFRNILDLSGSADVPTIDVGDYSKQSLADAGLSYSGEGSVALVYANGAILPGESSQFDDAQVGSTTLIEALEEARSSSDVKAIVLRINSPGGAASAGEAMWHAVSEAAGEKPLIVSMGGLAASAGYYIAAPADTIVANPTSITGSIGVYRAFFNAKGFFNEKAGVTFDGVQTSPYADIFSFVGPLTEGDREVLGASVDRSYSLFLRRVAEGRGMDTSAVDEVAQGRVWSGRDAIDAGLVDTLGTLEDAIQIAGERGGLGEGPFRTRILPRPKTFVERLNEELYGQASAWYQSLHDSPIETELRTHVRVLSRILGDPGTTQARLPAEIRIR